jgi:hypothetical protein
MLDESSRSAPTRTKWPVIIGVAVLVTAAVIAIWLVARDEPDLSPRTMLERLDAAGIEGCRSADDGTVSCVDVAGVAYFQGVWLDDAPSIEEVIDEACDESAVIVLHTEGEPWFGRVRAHPDRAADLATALGTTQTACPDAR